MQNNMESRWLWQVTNDTLGKLLLIIESAAFSYSVLQKWGYRAHYPIGAVVNDYEMIDEIAKKLGIFETQALNVNMPPVEFRKCLKDYHDDLCVILYSHGRYSSENMELLTGLTANGRYGELRIGALILVIFQQVIPEEYESYFSFVFQIESSDLKYMVAKMVRWFRDMLKGALLHNMGSIEGVIITESANGGPDARFWFAVAAMVGVIFQYYRKGMKEDNITALQEVYRWSETYSFRHQIPQLFCDAFDKTIPKISSFLDIKDCCELSAQEIKHQILYDSSSYFIPEELFIEICKPLQKICLASQIKETLMKEGILHVQGRMRNYYTIKRKVPGSDSLARFIWLNREELESNMEMSFVEKYKIRRGKNG